MLGDLFNPAAELRINDRICPHWSQAGAIVFATFRTKDSVPRDVLEQWNHEKEDWLARRGLLGPGDNWKDILSGLSDDLRNEFNTKFRRTREGFLDTCHGRCLLKRPEIAKIVADSLLHFDGVRYRMGDFVVMPNHVHLLAAFPCPERMEAQFASWLRFTATRINKSTGENGHFWQQEPFDHLVRSIAQYDYLRKYIAENPVKARLRKGQYYHRKYDGQIEDRR